MRILILNKYQNKVNRGAETFVSEFSRRLSKNHKIEVINRINYLSILKNKYDLIIPTNGRSQAIIIRFITWFRHSKMIIIGHSGVGFDDRLNLYSFPDCFVALSSFALKWAKKVNPLVKSVYIPNGVDLCKFNMQGSTLHISQTILSVGAFTKEKRHNLTIKAVSKLKNVKLIIVGSGGGFRQEIEALGNRLLKDKFKIMSVTNNKMPEIYKKADVLVFPTVSWESFGIVLLEAMACGLAVVATDDPIRREIVGDAGLLVDPTDIEAYAKAIEKTLNTNWGEKPRKQAEKFDWDKIALEYEKLLKEL